MSKRIPRIGEIFVKQGLVSWEQLDEALRAQFEAAHSTDVSAPKSNKHKQVTFLNVGEILINQGWIKDADLEAALKLQAETGDILGSILLKRSFVTEKNLQQALAIQHGMSFVSLEKIVISPEVLKTIPKHLAYELQLIPLVMQGTRLLVAVSNPKNVDGIAAIEKLLPNHDILTALMTAADLNSALAKYYGPA